MRIWKEILRPGRWHLRDGRVFECTPADLRHYARRMQEMVEAGLLIPACWEHDPKAVPLSQESWRDLHAKVAKNTVAHLKGAGLRGNRAGMVLDVTDPQDLKQLEKTGYVSPHIDWDYTDPRGKTWPGPSILHVAITPVPIQIDQEPFAKAGKDGASLSGAVSLETYRQNPRAQQFRRPVSLSGARYEPITLGSNPMAEEKKKDEGDKKPPDEPKEPKAEGEEAVEIPEVTAEPPVTEAPPPPPVPEPVASTGTGEMKLKEAVGALAGLGIMVGNDATLDNLPERIVIACRTKAACEAQLEEEEEPAEEEIGYTTPGQPPTQNAAPPPVMMSQADLQAENQRLKAQLLEGRKKELRGRIARIGKKLGDAIEKDLTAELTATAVSLSAAGTLEAGQLLVRIKCFEETIEAIEKNPKLKFKGSAASLSQANGKTKVSPPHDGIGNPPHDPNKVDDEVVNKLSGGRWGEYKAKQEKK